MVALPTCFIMCYSSSFSSPFSVFQIITFPTHPSTAVIIAPTDGGEPIVSGSKTEGALLLMLRSAFHTDYVSIRAQCFNAAQGTSTIFAHPPPQATIPNPEFTTTTVDARAPPHPHPSTPFQLPTIMSQLTSHLTFPSLHPTSR